jgi:hypothetical protein
LISLRYILKKGDISFKVQISKGKEEIEREIIREAIEEYLEKTYNEAAR